MLDLSFTFLDCCISSVDLDLFFMCFWGEVLLGHCREMRSGIRENQRHWFDLVCVSGFSLTSLAFCSMAELVSLGQTISVDTGHWLEKH